MNCGKMFVFEMIKKPPPLSLNDARSSYEDVCGRWTGGQQFDRRFEHRKFLFRPPL